jgi:hypothetical protein
MNTTIYLAVVGVLVALAVILGALLINQKRRSAKLRARFGPEYQRAVEQHGDERRAQEELRAREERVRALDIHPLTREQEERFRKEWQAIQAEFVDAPDVAVSKADRLVEQVMHARGYPIGDFEQRAADVSVEHADVVANYRSAHEIALKNEKGAATTEDLRQATIQYRALFEDLLETVEPEEKVMSAA